jgi:hypothetical protein
MRRLPTLFILLTIFGLTSSNFTVASEAVRVVDDITTVSANLEVSSSEVSGTDIDVAIPAISLSTVELNETDYQLVQLPAGDFLTAAETSEEGKPDIPALTTLIAIPDQAGIRLNVSYSGYDVFENIALAPVQPAQPESDPTPVPFAIDEAAYSTDAFYPGELAEASDPAIMRDVRLTQVALYPVQYNPLRKELRVYRDLSVSLSYDGEVVNPKTVHHRYLSDGFYPIYKSLISNFDQMFGTAEVRRGGYVIIAKNVQGILDSLDALAEWKHRKGYHVRIVPTSEINSNGSPTYLQIQEYLINAYASWDVPPEYVMIIGDQSGTFIVNDFPYQSTYASDHEYACLEGTDYLPEVFVGRYSISSMAEFRKGMAKIFKYERNPQMFDPLHWIRGFSIGYTYYTTARLTTLWVRQLQMQHGFVRVDTVYGQSDNPNIVAYLNQGRAMTQYRGAGSTDGWWGPSFTTSDVASLQNNQKLGVMAPLTCGTGDFEGECLGEAWIRTGLNPDSLKGGPAYFGVSDHDTHTKWNNPIMIGYYWGIFAEDNYHFASAAVRGKIQQYLTFPRYRSGGNWVELYFHTYNMLGDPELELRTAIPKYIVVAHEDTIAFGLNHFELNVTDSLGQPVKDAYVTLIKGSDSSEEVFSVEKTDESGNAVLFFDAATTGNIALTVSGRNLIPYLTDIALVTSDIAVGCDSTALDDDMSGFSYGNSDGQAGPAETLELTLALKNFGANLTATNVTASLESIDDMITMLDANHAYGDIPPGEVRLNDIPFLIRISPDAQDGDVYRLKLNVTDQSNDNWYSLVELPVMASKFIITNLTVVDENNRLDQGDTASIAITLANRGSVGAEDVTGYVTAADDYATILSSYSFFGDIQVDSSGSNDGTHISISTPSEIFDGHTVNLLLNLETVNGSRSIIPFSVTVGSVSTSDPTGPDAYGYYMYDKNDTSYAPHPTYVWINAAPRQGGQGTRLTFSGNTDDKSVLVTIPFDVVYYGQTYDHMIISINGFVAFDTARVDNGGNFWANFFNWSIPDPGNAAAQISPFWDDLRLGTGNSKGVFTWHDTTNHLFVIEYDSLTNVNGGAVEWFELAISDPAYHPTLTGDSEILFQYRIVNNNSDSDENYASVGFEDATETRGIEYTYDRAYPPSASTLANQMAIKITTNTGRGGIRGMANLNNGGQNQDVVVRASSGQNRITNQVGDYWIKNVPPGVVSLTAEKSGYFPETFDSITVTANQTTNSVDFSMTSCPVPTGLRASDAFDEEIALVWSPVSHEFFIGYDIYRNRWENGVYTKLNSQPLTVPGYHDTSVPDTSAYWYYVTALYSNQAWNAQSIPSNRDSGRLMNPVGAEDSDSQLPKEFFLSQNYPNPFNPTTLISYGLPQDTHVRLEIFNLLGQRITTLTDEYQKAGYRQAVWDGQDSFGKPVASGIYLYRLKAGDKEASKKMLMLK